MNFTRDVVDAAPGTAEALITIGRSGERRSWSFGEISDGAARLAGTLRANGVGRGDVVMTLVGNRADRGLVADRRPRRPRRRRPPLVPRPRRRRHRLSRRVEPVAPRSVTRSPNPARNPLA